MAYEDTLVKIITMPSMNTNNEWFETERYHNSKGIIVKGWTAWSGQTECKLLYLDILVDGDVVRYWRPCFGGHQTLDSPGMWEIAGNTSQAYEIKPIQSPSTE